jgi:hypothetical protein
MVYHFEPVIYAETIKAVPYKFPYKNKIRNICKEKFYSLNGLYEPHLIPGNPTRVLAKVYLPVHLILYSAL